MNEETMCELKTSPDDTQHVCSNDIIEQENKLLAEHKELLENMQKTVNAETPMIRSEKASIAEINAIVNGKILPGAEPAIQVAKEKEQKILDEILQQNRIETLKETIKTRSAELKEARQTYYEKYIKTKHEKMISYAIVDDKEKIIMKFKKLEGIQIYQSYSLVLIDKNDKILVKFNSVNDLFTVKNALNYLLSEPEGQPVKEIQEWAERIKGKQ